MTGLQWLIFYLGTVFGAGAIMLTGAVMHGLPFTMSFIPRIFLWPFGLIHAIIIFGRMSDWNNDDDDGEDS